ncbi:MAG: hypothetical protein ACP5P8_10065, partial [Thermus sp.]
SSESHPLRIPPFYDSLLGERVRLVLRAPEDPWVERLEAEKQEGFFREAFGVGLEVAWEV